MSIFFLSNENKLNRNLIKIISKRERNIFSSVNCEKSLVQNPQNLHEKRAEMSGNRRRINNDIVPLNPMVIVMRLARGSSQNLLLGCLTYGAVRS